MNELVIIALIVLVAVAWSGRHIWLTIRGKAACDSCHTAPAGSNAQALQSALGCNGCPLQPACKTNPTIPKVPAQGS